MQVEEAETLARKCNSFKSPDLSDWEMHSSVISSRDCLQYGFTISVYNMTREGLCSTGSTDRYKNLNRIMWENVPAHVILQ